LHALALGTVGGPTKAPGVRTLSFFTVVRLGEAALVWAEGPLDATVAANLHEALYTVVAQRAAPIVIDLVQVPSVNDSVVTALAAAASQAAQQGRGLELRLSGGQGFTVTGSAQLRQVMARAYPTAA
jgi:anti-anti-sigma regulatory factor